MSLEMEVPSLMKKNIMLRLLPKSCAEVAIVHSLDKIVLFNRATNPLLPYKLLTLALSPRCPQICVDCAEIEITHSYSNASRRHSVNINWALESFLEPQVIIIGKLAKHINLLAQHFSQKCFPRELVQPDNLLVLMKVL